MFDWLRQLQKAIEDRNNENIHRRCLENTRQFERAVFEEVGFVQAFKQYMSNRYQIDVDQVIKDCEDYAEDWESDVSDAFEEWKSGEFDEIEEAFEDLRTAIETMEDNQREGLPP